MTENLMRLLQITIIFLCDKHYVQKRCRLAAADHTGIGERNVPHWTRHVLYQLLLYTLWSMKNIGHTLKLILRERIEGAHNINNRVVVVNKYSCNNDDNWMMAKYFLFWSVFPKMLFSFFHNDHFLDFEKTPMDDNLVLR